MRDAAMENPTIVVITDRNDLDGQLFGVFSLAQDLLREHPVQANTRQDLRAKLGDRPSGGIVFATIQKFMPGEDEDTFPVLSERRNIVVIADEAHRTQYGFEAKFKGDEKGYQVGYAQHLRDALPNATFVAFTGTPVSGEDRDHSLAMSKAFSLCCTLDEAKAVREEVAFFQAVRVLLTKKDVSQKKRSDDQKDLAIRQIISSAVVSQDVVDIFESVGLDKPNIGILDEKFLAEIKNLPERNLAVELLERLLEGEIKSRFASNVVQEKKFSELLSNVITRYQNRAIETAQVMEELIAMAKKFKEAANRGEELGLTEDELRFYDALANNEAAVRMLGDETLRSIAHELTENLRRNISVDWAVRESVRASLRLMVKRVLRKYKYPPDQQDEAVATVLQQAERLSAEWDPA
jgi:type I site-specific restriction-modification system R (restriction) subunit